MTTRSITIRELIDEVKDTLVEEKDTCRPLQCNVGYRNFARVRGPSREDGSLVIQ